MSDLEAAIERLDEFYRRGVSGYSPDDIERDSQIGDDVLTVLSAARQSVPVTAEEVAVKALQDAEFVLGTDRNANQHSVNIVRRMWKERAAAIRTRKPTETEEEE